MATLWYLDVPNPIDVVPNDTEPNDEQEWRAVRRFQRKADAIAWIREHIGPCDENGCVCLLQPAGDGPEHEDDGLGSDPEEVWKNHPAKPEMLVVIKVDGGVVQEVISPDGVNAVVRDYDFEGADEAEVATDADGNEYVEYFPFTSNA